MTSSARASSGVHMYGPLLSASDVEAHVNLYTDVFGMERVDSVTLAADLTERLFSTPAGTLTLTALRTPGVLAGAVVAAFEPRSERQIRTEETRLHRDAFRVIDFYAPDLDAAVAHARQLGHHVEHSEAGYDLDEGAFREAHLPGPDGVVTAFLSGPRDFFTGFAKVRDRIASEVCSISLPLTDAKPSLEFYKDVLDWDVVFEYSFSDESFNRLMDVEEPITVTSSTVGFARDEPYVNMVDYGAPEGLGGSVRGQSVAPHRGLLGAVLTTDALDAVRARAGEALGAEVTFTLAPFGEVRAAVLTPPHAVPHLILEV